jgi:hypothetical protein
MVPQHRKQPSKGSTAFFSATLLVLVISWSTVWETATAWAEHVCNQTTCAAESMMRDFIWHAYRGGF